MRDGHTLLQDQLAAIRATEDATIRRMAQAGYSDVEIGAHLSRDRQYVGRRRREFELQPGQHPALRAMVARLNFRRRAALHA